MRKRTHDAARIPQPRRELAERVVAALAGGSRRKADEAVAELVKLRLLRNLAKVASREDLT